VERCFTATANATPFKAVVANIDLNLKNVAINEWQRRSEKFDLTKEDAIPDLEFSIVLWHAIKGDHVPFPGPRRAAFFKPIKKVDKDDD
jgi:phosphoribosylformimino-5-aminoimidazole carboxamide ribonucleotide (ProFAR) isomerase